MATSSDKYLISSILRDGDMKTAVANGVTSSMMNGHAQEFEWMESYYSKHRKAPSKGAFQSKFPEFRIKAVNDTGHFADLVKRDHTRRMLVGVVNEVTDLLMDDKMEEAITKVTLSTAQIAGAMGIMHDGDIFSDYEDILDDVKNRITRVEEFGSAGIPSGFPTWDERTGGAQPGDFIVVGARLGEGKSWTLQKWASHAAAKHKVHFSALEQTRPQVTFRIHSFLSSDTGQSLFKSSSLMQGKDLDIAEYKRFLKKLKQRMKGNLHVTDARNGRVGLATIAAHIEKNQPDIYFLDYITLMDKKGGEWQDVAALSNSIKILAIRYGIPIVSAAQLNRANGLSKDPAGPEALAQSDAIGQDADAVITMKQTSPSTIVMRAAKVRNGKGNFKWYNHFDPDAGILQEVSHEKFLTLKDKDADEATA